MAQSRVKIGVIGASGYIGSDLVRLAVRHPGIDVRVLTANTHAGKAMDEVFPHLGGLDLPDLKSRMQGTALVSLSGPDDALLTAVLVKLFNDRQIALDANVLPYLVTRMDRSFAAAGQLVDALDQAALAQKRPITKALAGPVLDKLAKSGA